MANEKFGALVSGMHQFEQSMRAVRWAFENIEGLSKHSEVDTVGFFKRYDLVWGVWFDPEANTLKVQVLKGREPNSDEIMQANAIPCVDEADARRWAALLNTPDNPIPESLEEGCRLHIATIDGKSMT